MKGQYLTIEYVIFFTIGIIMIIATYFVFTNLNTTFRENMIEYQVQMTGEMITGTIINLIETSNSTNSTIYYNLSIPTRLSNCIYSISVTEKKLNINCIEILGTEFNFTLYNFNINTKNIIYSTNGLLKINITNGVVELT